MRVDAPICVLLLHLLLISAASSHLYPSPQFFADHHIKHHHAIDKLADVCEKRQCLETFSFERLFSLLMLVYSLLPSDCQEDLDVFKKSFSSVLRRENVTDAERNIVTTLVDATGKPSPGITKGHLAFFGTFSQCTSLMQPVANRTRPFVGAYFRLYMDVELRSRSEEGACSELSSPATGQTPLFLALDVCLPASCDTRALYTHLVDGPNATDTPICSVRGVNDGAGKPGASYYIIQALFIAIAAFCVVVGAADYLLSEKLQDYHPVIVHRIWKFLTIFSALRNISSIFAMIPQNQKQTIRILPCIRVLSCSWVIFGQLLLVYLNYTSNPIDVLDMTKDVTTELLVNAFFAVDTFFFLSGLILAFNWFKSYKERPKDFYSPSSWVYFYVHRLFRLSPPYYAAVLFTAFVFNVNWLVDMPLYMRPNVAEDPCKTSWWAELLFINNYLFWDKPCLGQAWYLAASMQMFIFSPLVLVPLALVPAAGVAIAVAFILASTAAHVFTIFYFHYPPASVSFGPSDPEAEQLDKYQLYVFAAPYIRCQVYIAGMLVGWLLHFRRRRIHPTLCSVVLALALWVSALCLMLLALLGLHSFNSGLPLSLAGRAAYSALSRLAWTAGLSFIILACEHGYGGPVNRLMSHGFWTPLSRLTYSAFLVHMLVILYVTGLTKNDIYFSNFTELCLTRGLPAIVITFFVAIFWSAFYEIPFSKLEVLFWVRIRNERKRKVSEMPPQENKEQISNVTSQ